MCTSRRENEAAEETRRCMGLDTAFDRGMGNTAAGAVN